MLPYGRLVLFAYVPPHVALLHGHINPGGIPISCCAKMKTAYARNGCEGDDET